jgi:hypothetical protein
MAGGVIQEPWQGVAVEHMMRFARLLDEETDLFEYVIAQLDITELGCVGELQLFPKAVEDSGVEVGPLVQHVQQFSGSGCVLVVGFDSTRILNGHGQRECAEVVDWLVG